MMKWFLLSIQMCVVGFLYGSDFYVSTNGNNGNAGDIDHPFRTLQYAITQIDIGDAIYMREGTYSESVTITILTGNDGEPNNRKKIIAYSDESVILDFSSMTENSSNRGIQLYGNYWHIKGLIIQNAGDNGMSIGGNYNIVEDCIFRKNHDTGLQISRMNSSLNNMSDWPSNNQIINCESYDNSDSDHEDADGFAAKLTCGPGNIFQNCVSHHNIDDGWDLYTKSETGPIGPVSLIACIAHSNGSLTDGSTSGNGDKNGFKLGGEDIAVNHIVRRCVAFNNGKHGFTYNRNLGSIEMTNCTAYQNSERNYNFDGGSSVFTNNLSYLSGSNDRIIGSDTGTNVWDNDDDPLYIISAGDFVSLLPGDNNAPYNTGFLQLQEGGQLIDKGAIVEEISYQGLAPDIGAFEYGGTIFRRKYVLNVSVEDNLGGSVVIDPLQDLYDSASVVTLQAIPDADYTFAGWSGDYSGTDASIELIIDDNKDIKATFITDKVALNIFTSGPGSIHVDPVSDLYTKGTIINLTAIANKDCYFIGWTGDTISDENPLSLTIEKDMNITGMFQNEPVQEIVCQFESSEVCEGDGSVDNKHTGYMGTGFFDFTNAVGASIQISVDAMEDTPCEVTVRYALGKEELRPMEVQVNGIQQQESVDFPATGEFTNWDSVTFSLTLQKGNNRIDFISLGSEGGANFDQVRLLTSEALIAKGYCDEGPPVEFTLTVNVSPAEAGDVIVEPSGSIFEEGTLVNLTAVPNEGFHFAGWSNGQETASINISMSADSTLLAYFEEGPDGIAEYTISPSLSMRIYPNPVSEYAVFEISTVADVRADVILIDIYGRSYPLYSGMLSKDQLTNIPFDANGFAPGMYFVTVRSDNLISVEKIRIN